MYYFSIKSLASLMHLNEPIDIMLACCLRDRSKLAMIINSFPLGETARVRIVKSEAVRSMVETFSRNRWCRIDSVEEGDATSILSIVRTH